MRTEQMCTVATEGKIFILFYKAQSLALQLSLLKLPITITILTSEGPVSAKGVMTVAKGILDA